MAKFLGPKGVEDIATELNIGNVTTANNTTETVLGVLRVPGGMWTVATCFEFEAFDTLSTADNVARYRIRIGTSSTTPATNTAVAFPDFTGKLSSSSTCYYTRIRGAITTTGASANFTAHGFALNSGNNAACSESAAASGTFNSSNTSFLMVTYQNESAVVRTIQSACLKIKYK